MSGLPSGPVSLPAGTLAFIDDGYTEQGYIASEPGQYPAIRFEFRRMTTSEAKQYQADLRRLPDQNDVFALNELGARYLVTHLLSWDIMDSKGVVMPIAAAFLAHKIKREVFARLLRIVSGQGPSDMDPEWNSVENEPEIAAASGQITQEGSAKNS